MKSSLINDVVAVVREAGAAIQAVRASAELAVAAKSDESPVTAADHAADALLREWLLTLSNAAWLSEESVDDKSRLTASRLWIVDPLDGTKEFVEGLPQYAIAVGLVERGETTLGVVHNPATGDVFSAMLGEGAYMNGDRIRVAEGETMLASRSEMKRGEFEPFSDWKLEAIGSIALKLALIAAGRAAVTISRGPKWEWDVCAGSLLVSEAGGAATDMFGGPLRFNNSFPKVKGILAGSSAAHARVLDRVSELGASDRMAEMG